MLARAALVVCFATACSFHPGVATDARGDDAPDDAPPRPADALAATGCFASWLTHTVQVDPPAQLTELADPGQDRDPFLSADETVIYWVTDRNGATFGSEIAFATRATASGPFSNIFIKASLSSAQSDSKITMAEDDLFVIESSARTGGQGGGYDFWQATRSSGGTQAFPPLTQDLLGAVNDATDQFDPTLSRDALHLYYAVGAPQRIVVASRTTRQEPFGAPVEVPGINGGTGDADPAISNDERVILFSSVRPGNLGYIDLWYATRATPTGAFSAPVQVPTVNQAGVLQGDAHLTRDGCHLYFSSNRSGNEELYVATVH